MRSRVLLPVLSAVIAMTPACAPFRWVGHAIDVLGTPPAPSVKASPKGFSGRLVTVDSGTRLRVMPHKDLRAVKVELAGLQPPDPALASQARLKLAELCAHTSLRVRPVQANRGDSRVAYVYAGDRWINLAMVEAGLLQPLPEADPRLLKAANDRLSQPR